MAIKSIKLIKPPGYPAVGQALGRARACLGSEDHWFCTLARRIYRHCSGMTFKFYRFGVSFHVKFTLYLNEDIVSMEMQVIRRRIEWSLFLFYERVSVVYIHL
jgi:hypothetical protein